MENTLDYIERELKNYKEIYFSFIIFKNYPNKSLKIKDLFG